MGEQRKVILWSPQAQSRQMAPWGKFRESRTSRKLSGLRWAGCGEDWDRGPVWLLLLQTRGQESAGGESGGSVTWSPRQ